jgi:hypothetical protein
MENHHNDKFTNLDERGNKEPLNSEKPFKELFSGKCNLKTL